MKRRHGITIWLISNEYGPVYAYFTKKKAIAEIEKCKATGQCALKEEPYSITLDGEF